jgi:hypothetical protein
VEMYSVRFYFRSGVNHETASTNYFASRDFCMCGAAKGQVGPNDTAQSTKDLLLKANFRERSRRLYVAPL